MRKFVWVILFVFLFALQGSLWLVWPNCWSFDLLLPAVYFFGLLYGETAGFVMGLLVGLVQDSLTPGFFGFHMLTRCAVGYGIGVLRDRIFNDECSLHVSVIGLICIAVKLMAGILVMLFSLSLRFWPVYMMDGVLFTMTTMLWSVPLFHLMRWLADWADTEEKLFEAVTQTEHNRLCQEYRKQHEGLRYHRHPNGEE